MVAYGNLSLETILDRGQKHVAVVYVCDRTGWNNSGELLICVYICIPLLKGVRLYFCFEFGTLVVLKVPHNAAFLSLSSKDYQAVLLALNCCFLLYCFIPETAMHWSLIAVSLPSRHTHLTVCSSCWALWSKKWRSTAQKDAQGCP